MRISKREPGINRGKKHYTRAVCLSIGRLIGGSSARCELGTSDLRASRATWRDARASNPALHFIWEKLLVTRKRNAYTGILRYCLSCTNKNISRLRFIFYKELYILMTFFYFIKIFLTDMRTNYFSLRQDNNRIL